ncbi:RNA polymerase sigma-70 factor (ECF subfamily) [Aquimarina sp. EL_43]|uniref:RNA polymerase sigma factor n=1 Tax=unclassified Aquimarina TaxID=2627091 RepID=UPI0018C926BF|nr:MULTISPECIES: sigma-70 family RNA polymerase sigma factor [unclassified Aquimarina]MBG6129999.1 RNA polymerase sigma-70 factor (ECF subfamily) [Aquimarina sp. EL_35]MBG6148779.1 RNA polymerase sigma-70 factor (ECF subfamily) [Aquimarina sp. EL_32]MBG6168847.1 RNA polymerase sigma-70 factor (ECF subfamily) [Aquimarina sp. EL_43]
MTGSKTNIRKKIDHLFRHEYGKLVAVLTKTFGTSNIELAEDVVQEAMLEALNKWSYEGIPDNPTGWIYKVAKYKAVNIVNREQYKREHASEVARHLQSEWTVAAALKHIFTDKEIADDQLRMIFTCCHPSISTDSQIALTLKTLCGFSIPEIAKAFLTTNENINKRLVRARKTIKEANIPFEVPVGKKLEHRLSSVLETIYLLFNEGYNATSGDTIIRFELCEEAIRLAEIIASNANINSSQTYALLALMSLNTSRFDSRIDKSNNLLNLEHQDRNKWDKALIKKGLYYLEFSAKQNEISIYHILATISAHHCTAKTYESTDWESILALYDLLVDIDNSPLVLLNRVVVIAKLTNSQEALEQLNNIEGDSIFLSYLPYYTTKAELHFKNNEPKIAIELLNNALKLPLNKNSKALINNRLKEYSKKI